MPRYKVIVIQEFVSSYNDAVYEIMNNSVDLTIAYTSKCEVKEPKYKTLELPHWKLSSFVWHKKFNRLINQYDVVIVNGHFRLVKAAILPFLPHKPKVISWTIGVHVSYKKAYNLSQKPDTSDKLLQMLNNHCDACIFYMPQPIEYWKQYKNIDESKYFVAHNTVKVADFDELPSIEERDKFLFVGTLYKQKGISELIEAYDTAKKKIGSLPKLYIVGKGPEEHLVKDLVDEKGLSDCVVMTGAIYDENILKDYFLSSLLCISPKQAGLSVQKSLGYGVPFVTRPDSITGGERLDIKDKENGFFYDSIEELSEILVNAATNPAEIDKMSSRAREYYLAEASPEKMAQGALDAIEYVMTKD